MDNVPQPQLPSNSQVPFDRPLNQPAQPVGTTFQSSPMLGAERPMGNVVQGVIAKLMQPFEGKGHLGGLAQLAAQQGTKGIKNAWDNRITTYTKDNPLDAVIQQYKQPIGPEQAPPPEPPPQQPSPMAASVVQSQPIQYRDKNIKIDPVEVNQYLRPMLYSEVESIFNRPTDKIDLEIRTVINTVLNRMNNRKKSMKDVVTAPNQYQGVGTKKFNAFHSNTNEYEQKQINFINQTVDAILSEIEQGTFQDNVTGAEFYGHAKDGTIRAYDSWEQYKRAIKAGKIK